MSRKKPPSQWGESYEYVNDPSKIGNTRPTPAPVKPLKRTATPLTPGLGTESKKVQAAADAALKARQREMAIAELASKLRARRK